MIEDSQALTLLSRMQLNEHAAYPQESPDAGGASRPHVDADPTIAIAIRFDSKVRFVMKRDRRQNGDRRASGRGGRRKTDTRR